MLVIFGGVFVCVCACLCLCVRLFVLWLYVLFMQLLNIVYSLSLSYLLVREKSSACFLTFRLSRGRAEQLSDVTKSHYWIGQ